MFDSNAVNVFYNSTKGLIEFLDEKKEPTFRSEVEQNFTKVLLLSAASFFEQSVKLILNKFVEITSANNVLIKEFLNNRAIGDKYFQLFSWDDNNANKFFSLFGKDFKQQMKGKVSSDKNLDDAIKSFLEIGSWRNKLVHNNFAEYDFPKTSDEVYKLYNSAKKFMTFLEEELCGEDIL